VLCIVWLVWAGLECAVHFVTCVSRALVCCAFCDLCDQGLSVLCVLWLV